MEVIIKAGGRESNEGTMSSSELKNCILSPAKGEEVGNRASWNCDDGGFWCRLAFLGLGVGGGGRIG
jgi:hypothetical protein